MRNHQASSPVFEVPIESGFLERWGSDHDVNIRKMGEGQQRLHFALRNQPMFKVQPDAVKTVVRRVADVSRNEVPQCAHPNGFVVTNSRKRFAWSHGAVTRLLMLKNAVGDFLVRVTLDQTSQSLTASVSPTSGSRVGINS